MDRVKLKERHRLKTDDEMMIKNKEDLRMIMKIEILYCIHHIILTISHMDRMMMR